MSNKQKIAVFAVSFWKDSPHPLFNFWKERVDKFINFSDIFLCPGSYSNPSVMNNQIDVVQLGIKNTLPYNKNWSYYHVGFLTGIYNTLINIKDFDALIHIQDSVLLNLDLNGIVSEFMERGEILAAPKFTSDMGCFIETGLMIMKRPAVERYATSHLRPSLTTNETMNVEEEAFYMFKDEWWNFLPEITTIRKRDFTVSETGNGIFELSDEEFISSPVIMTSGYTTDEENKLWLEKNKIT